MEIYIGVLLLFLLLALGVPVFLAMAMAGTIGLIFVADFNTVLGIFETNTYTSVAHYTFLSIPLFILMANFLTSSNITRDLFWVAQKWIGRLPGGLAISTILAGAGLGALSGTSTAAAATLAGAAVPEMNKHGYSTKLSMGVVSISGTLAIMIPPSGTLIIFGLISGYSITELFRAAIIPGIVTTLVYIIVVLIWVKRHPDAAPRVDEKVSFKEKVFSLKELWPILLLLLIVIVSIFSGWVTITEAAGVAALGSFLIPLFMGRMTIQKVFEALLNTIKTTTMIFAIIIGALVFGYYLTLTQITRLLVTFISELDLAAVYIVLIFVLLYAFLGLFMDQVAILFLTLPLAIPVVEALGVDVIWFAILIVAAAETGLVTPPLGLNCYVASGATGESLEKTFKGVMPFVVAQFGVIFLIFFFPWLTSIL